MSIVTTGTPSQTFWHCEERVKVAYVCGAIAWARKDLPEELRQPRLQGFSLSRWLVTCLAQIFLGMLFLQPAVFSRLFHFLRESTADEVGAVKPCGEWNASYGRRCRQDRRFAAKTLARAKTIPLVCHTRLSRVKVTVVMLCYRISNLFLPLFWIVFSYLFSKIFLLGWKLHPHDSLILYHTLN